MRYIEMNMMNITLYHNSESNVMGIHCQGTHAFLRIENKTFIRPL